MDNILLFHVQLEIKLNYITNQKAFFTFGPNILIQKEIKIKVTYSIIGCLVVAACNVLELCNNACKFIGLVIVFQPQ